MLTIMTCIGLHIRKARQQIKLRKEFMMQWRTEGEVRGGQNLPQVATTNLFRAAV